MTASTGAFVIEVEDQTVGIVVPDEGNAFRFFASIHTFYGLEQQRFSTPRAAQRAAQAWHADRRRGRSPTDYIIA